jgi:hypothetical protein
MTATVVMPGPPRFTAVLQFLWSFQVEQWGVFLRKTPLGRIGPALHQLENRDSVPVAVDDPAAHVAPMTHS